MILNPAQADEIIVDGRAYFVTIGRAFIDDPKWGWHAATALRETLAFPGAIYGPSPTLARLQLSASSKGNGQGNGKLMFRERIFSKRRELNLFTSPGIPLALNCCRRSNC
jgi:hypothetical protein